MKQVVKIKAGQLNRLTGKKWASKKTKDNRKGSKGNRGKEIESFAIFNPRIVTMIGDRNPTIFISELEREHGKEFFPFLEESTLVDYNPIEEEL